MIESTETISDSNMNEFSSILKPSGKITLLGVSPYSVQIGENTDQKNSENGQFSRSKSFSICVICWLSRENNKYIKTLDITGIAILFWNLLQLLPLSFCEISALRILQFTSMTFVSLSLHFVLVNLGSYVNDQFSFCLMAAWKGAPVNVNLSLRKFS